jgi:hypothetical protein
MANRPDDLKGARSGYNVFSIAVLVNLFRNARHTLPIEWYIVFLLVVIIPYGASIAITSMSDLYNSRLAIYVQFIIYMIFSIASPWLFCAGIDIERKPGCEIKKGFFFGDVYLYHTAWRTVGKVVSIFAAIWGLYHVKYIFLYIVEPRVFLEGKDPNSDPLWIHIRHNPLALIIPIHALSSAPIAIAFIEKTTQVNDLNMSARPISAAGQLIPLMVSTYVLFTTIMAVLKQPFLRLVGWITQQKSFSQAVRFVSSKAALMRIVDVLKWPFMRALRASRPAVLDRARFGF